MTAGISSRPYAASNVPFGPQIVVVLIGALLVFGFMLVAAFGLIKPAAQSAASASEVSQALLQVRAGERASWGAAAAAADEVSQALIQHRAGERAALASIQSYVAQALIQQRADERTSWTGEASRTAQPTMSERDALRREHVPAPGAAPTNYTIPHGPLE